MSVRLLVLTAATVCLATLSAGCSSGSDAPSGPAPAPSVASVQKTPPGDAEPSKAPVDPADDPRRLRFDAAEGEIQAILNAWYDCMSDHGVKPPADLSGPTGMWHPSFNSSAEDFPKADAACQDLKPLPDWNEDARNPEAMAYMEAVADCMREHGGKGVSIMADKPVGQLGVTAINDAGLDAYRQCRLDTPHS